MNDELLFKNLDIIESFKAPYCIINNTLLGLFRDGKCFPQDDRECVILLNSNQRHFVRNHPLACLDVGSETSLGNINLKDKIAVNFMTEIGGKLVINSYLDYFFVFEKKDILPFAFLKYKGRSIPIPANTVHYLTKFYGDWRTPIPPDQWDWINSKGIIRAKSFDEVLNKYGST